jgi:general nucleoside transport system permease protein
VKRRIDLGKLLPQLIAPVAALLLAAGISSIVLLISGKDPFSAFSSMVDYGFTADSLSEILSKSTENYVAAVAVALGFKMGLFNIGTDGQSKVGAFFAGSLVGASWMAWMPGQLKIVVIIVIAMVVGAAWASIAALLKVYRGVSEVISTLMLNIIAGLLVTWLLNDYWGVEGPGGQIKTTPILGKDAWMPGIPIMNWLDRLFRLLNLTSLGRTSNSVLGFFAIALLLGMVYWFVLNRTRFGFDLRATGWNPSAAVASGINARRMVVVTMLLSGAVAGLINLPRMLGETHTYTEGFASIGFTGIAVALIGRNHPFGMALGAFLWGFLARSQLALDLEGIPKEIVLIMQGVTVLAVVVAYELASRIGARAQQRRVGASTATAPEPVAAGASLTIEEPK